MEKKTSLNRQFVYYKFVCYNISNFSKFLNDCKSINLVRSVALKESRVEPVVLFSVAKTRGRDRQDRKRERQTVLHFPDYKEVTQVNTYRDSE